MSNFFGEYESTVDDKQRFLFPVALKKQMPEGTNVFLLNRGFENCITLYTNADWDNEAAKLNNLDKYDEESRTLKRMITRGISKVELDSAGRMKIPQTLKDYAKIEKHIIISAQGDYVEIWDAYSYKKLFDDFDAKAFSELAKKKLGKSQV